MYYFRKKKESCPGLLQTPVSIVSLAIVNSFEDENIIIEEVPLEEHNYFSKISDEEGDVDEIHENNNLNYTESERRQLPSNNSSHSNKKWLLSKCVKK